jgi:excisionase family DNA binding protein
MSNGTATTPYSIEEVAKLFGIGRNAAYEAAHRGDFPVFRVGRRLLVPRPAIDRLLAEGRAPAAKAA